MPACQALAGVVVDAGFSATNVVPFFEGRPLLDSVRRINLGGKALGNFLKELVTYRWVVVVVVGGEGGATTGGGGGEGR
jgi:actin-related protein 6